MDIFRSRKESIILGEFKHKIARRMIDQLSIQRSPLISLFNSIIGHDFSELLSIYVDWVCRACMTKSINVSIVDRHFEKS